MGFLGGSVVKNSPAMKETQETWVWSLGQEDPLQEGMAIPWTKEPGGLQSIESQRVRHDRERQVCTPSYLLQHPALINKWCLQTFVCPGMLLSAFSSHLNLSIRLRGRCYYHSSLQMRSQRWLRNLPRVAQLGGFQMIWLLTHILSTGRAASPSLCLRFHNNPSVSLAHASTIAIISNITDEDFNLKTSLSFILQVRSLKG